MSNPTREFILSREHSPDVRWFYEITYAKRPAEGLFDLETDPDCLHNWCRRYILYHNKRHPLDMGKQEVEAFLTHLAVDEHASASARHYLDRRMRPAMSVLPSGSSFS